MRPAQLRSVQFNIGCSESTLTWIIAASQSSTGRPKMFVFSVQNMLCFDFCVPFGPTWMWEICVVKTEKAHWCLSILGLKFVMCMLQTSHEKKTSKQPNRVCWSKDYTRNLLEKKEQEKKRQRKIQKQYIRIQIWVYLIIKSSILDAKWNGIEIRVGRVTETGHFI